MNSKTLQLGMQLSHAVVGQAELMRDVSWTAMQTSPCCSMTGTLTAVSSLVLR